jgi:hypothetical protein
MALFVLAHLVGVLTIQSPCILPSTRKSHRLEQEHQMADPK